MREIHENKIRKRRLSGLLCNAKISQVSRTDKSSESKILRRYYEDYDDFLLLECDKEKCPKHYVSVSQVFYLHFGGFQRAFDERNPTTTIVYSTQNFFGAVVHPESPSFRNPPSRHL